MSILPVELLEAAEFCELDCIYDLYENGRVYLRCDGMDVDEVASYFMASFEHHWIEDREAFIESTYSNPEKAKQMIDDNSAIRNCDAENGLVTINIDRLAVYDEDGIDMFYLQSPLDETIEDAKNKYEGLNVYGFVYTNYSDYKGGELIKLEYGNEKYDVIGETLDQILHAEDYGDYESIWDCMTEELELSEEFASQITECFDSYSNYITEDDYACLESLKELI